MRTTSPCFNCSDRSMGCHSICEKYTDWKAEHEAKREIERQRKEEFNNGYTWCRK